MMSSLGSADFTARFITLSFHNAIEIYFLQFFLIKQGFNRLTTDEPLFCLLRL